MFLSVEEQVSSLLITSQERFLFLENPVQYLTKLKYKNMPRKKLLESKQAYSKRLETFYDLTKKEVKILAEEYVQPSYVYYKGQKIQVPDDFYLDYKTPDKTTYLEYLEEEDRKKNIITSEDREKARLLNCGVDYNYLQTLINKMNVNPDLTVTIKTKDGSIINMRKTETVEDVDVGSNEIVVEPLRVK